MLCANMVKIGLAVLVKISHLEEERGPSFEKKFESPPPKDALWQVSLKLAKRFWRRRFLNFVNAFSLFPNYLLLEKGLNPLYPQMLCAKFSWNWFRGSGEDFKFSSIYFHYFVIISPWRRLGPSLYEIESLSLKDALCQNYTFFENMYWLFFFFKKLNINKE